MNTVITIGEFVEAAKQFVSVSDKLSDDWRLVETEDLHRTYLKKETFINSTKGGLPMKAEYIVFYNLSYGVPSFSFNIWNSSGALLTLEDIRQMAITEINQKDFYSAITQKEHPILCRPYFIMHPCHTEALLIKHLRKKAYLMDILKKNWFTEIWKMSPGGSFSFEVKEVLYSEKSQYQDIKIFDTTTLGRVMVLDGIIQFTQKDEFSYQEMISFLPLCCHKNPERVLIVGGGDGGVAREVAKHPKVKQIVLVEIDEKVIEVSKKYLQFMAVGFDSEKLTLHVGDGFEFMKNHSREFDVIITDSTDPVGPAINLFQENYFALMKSALRPGGIVCSQASTVWYDLDFIQNTLKLCRNQFPSVAYAQTSVPTYTSGQIGFIIGSLEENKVFSSPEVILSREEEEQMDLRYYNSDVHSAAFALPTFVKCKLA